MTKKEDAEKPLPLFKPCQRKWGNFAERMAELKGIFDPLAKVDDLFDNLFS